MIATMVTAIKTLEDLPKRTIEQIEFHFNHYKDLKKPGTTQVKGFFGLEEAQKVIEDASNDSLSLIDKFKSSRGCLVF